MRVAELLLAMGAEVRVADPHVVEAHAPPGATRVDLTPQEADAIVLLTDHDAFNLSLLDAATCTLLDTRRVLSPRPDLLHL